MFEFCNREKKYNEKYNGKKKTQQKKSKKQAPFSMAIGNVELTHECSTKHSCMGTARMKLDKETKRRR